MVRTKTRARTFEERWPNGSPNYHLPPKGRLVSNNHPFKDHNGNPTLMSWESTAVEQPLPPLASWVFYMVHPDVSRYFDGCAFYHSLKADRNICRSGRFRYEFFFLPGVTTEECVAHFRGEMGARGTIWRGIRKAKRAWKESSLQEVYHPYPMQEPVLDEEESMSIQDSDNESDQGGTADSQFDSQLPGMIWPNSDYQLYYRGNFFMYSDEKVEVKDGTSGECIVDLVEFDPVPQDWYGEWGFEEGEDIEAQGEWDTMKHPIRVSRMNPRDDEYSNNYLAEWMEAQKCTHWEDEANNSTYYAIKLGWESW